jgi:hypothetical protein
VALIPDSDEKADLDAPSGDAGKLVVSQAPNITITSTTVVADEAERLGLEVQEGDIAIQQDTTESFIFTGGANVAINWKLVQFDAVGGIDGEDISPRDIDGRNVVVTDIDTDTLAAANSVTTGDLSVSGLLNGADVSTAGSGEALTSDGSGGFGFADVGGIEEVATFDDLPAVNPPQLAYVIDSGEYYHSEPFIGNAFDVKSASFDTSIDAQSNRPFGLAFNDDGTRLYESYDSSAVGGGNKIYQSNLSTPFEITSASFESSITSEDFVPSDIAFSNDGSRLFESGRSDEKVYQSILSTPFEITSASFDTSISSEDSSPQGIAFNNDGSRLFEIGNGSNQIYQSNLSTPFEITSASFDSSINTQGTDPKGITVNDDGSRLYEVGRDSAQIFQSTLSTPFDITSASFDTSINTQDIGPEDIAFNNDGSRLFEIGAIGDKIYQSILITGGWEEF